MRFLRNIAITLILISCSSKGSLQELSTETNKNDWAYQCKTKTTNNHIVINCSPCDMKRVCFPSDYLKNFDSTQCAQFRIFNRWGEQLFQSKNLDSNWVCNDNWDPKIKEGTYFYVLNYKHLNSDSIFEFQSTINVICSN
ncbi:MAG: hypothetical protein ACI80H_001405 [Pseudoalteromonas distincta]|jgi:hypothetical protein